MSPFPKYSARCFVAAGPKPVVIRSEKRRAVEITRLRLPSVAASNFFAIKILKTRFVIPKNIRATIVRIVFLKTEFFKLITPS